MNKVEIPEHGSGGIYILFSLGKLDKKLFTTSINSPASHVGWNCSGNINIRLSSPTPQPSSTISKSIHIQNKNIT